MSFKDFDEKYLNEIEKLKSEPVTSLNLGTRVNKCFELYEIDTVYDLVTKSSGELLRMKNFGKVSYKMIVEVLRKRGFECGKQGFNLEIHLKAVEDALTEVINADTGTGGHLEEVCSDALRVLNQIKRQLLARNIPY